jgi:hypothetical protein
VPCGTLIVEGALNDGPSSSQFARRVSFDRELRLGEHSRHGEGNDYQIIDDIDGSKGAEEVSFAYQGVDYSIDLSKKNKNALERALKPYIEAGTKKTRSGGRGAAKRASGRRDRFRARVGQGPRDRGFGPGAGFSVSPEPLRR